MVMRCFCSQRARLKARNALKGDLVVATTMSNMGLEAALKRSGIRIAARPGRYKYVLEEMNKTGATLGGEQSGHILFRDGDATTGDGLLTAAAHPRDHREEWEVAQRTA